MANHPEYYSVFMKDVAYWSSFDPSFSMPALLMIMNYTLIQNSKHPFLVNIRQNWTPFSKALCIIYGTGITMVLPQTYLISYLAFGTTHLIVTKMM